GLTTIPARRLGHSETACFFPTATAFLGSRRDLRARGFSLHLCDMTTTAAGNPGGPVASCSSSTARRAFAFSAEPSKALARRTSNHPAGQQGPAADGARRGG